MGGGNTSPGKGPGGGPQAAPPPPAQDFGNRIDGSKKGEGWLGRIPMQDGSGAVMTEQTADMEVNGERVVFPLIHPGSTKEEIDTLAKGGRLPRESVMRALEHALKRKKQGLSPYKD